MFFQHTLQTRSSIAFRIAYRTRSITAFRYRIPALQEQMLSRMSYSSRSKLKLVDLLSWYYGSSNMISFRNWIARTKIL